MKQRMLYLLTLPTLFTCCMLSCTGDDSAGSVLLSSENSLHISSIVMDGSSHLETDAITRLAGDNVPVALTKGSLGIFRSRGEFQMDVLYNKCYTYTGATNGWQAATATDIIYLSASNARVCAYYPYNSGLGYTDFAILPLNSGKYIGTPGQHDPNDLCYATDRTMSSFNRSTSFNLKHALALLEFKISKHADYIGDCRITSVKIANPELIVSSSLDITTGSYGTPTKGAVTYNPGTDSNGILIGSNAFTTAALLVPCELTTTGLIISLIMNGKYIEEVVPINKIARLEAGCRYTVKITLKDNKIQVTGVDALPWIDTEVGGENAVWYLTPQSSAGMSVSVDDITLGGTKCLPADKELLSGLFWAKGNLKSKSMTAAGDYVWGTPTDYGYYYTWMSLYTGNASFTGTQDPCEQLDPKKYGSGWRTPYIEEFESLSRCTDGTFELYNGIRGTWYMSKVEGKGLFLPAAYFDKNGSSDILKETMYGMYWSRDSADDINAWLFYFNGPTVQIVENPRSKKWGMSVRCVSDK